MRILSEKSFEKLPDPTIYLLFCYQSQAAPNSEKTTSEDSQKVGQKKNQNQKNKKKGAKINVFKVESKNHPKFKSMKNLDEGSFSVSDDSSLSHEKKEMIKRLPVPKNGRVNRPGGILGGKRQQRLSLQPGRARNSFLFNPTKFSPNSSLFSVKKKEREHLQNSFSHKKRNSFFAVRRRGSVRRPKKLPEEEEQNSSGYLNRSQFSKKLGSNSNNSRKKIALNKSIEESCCSSQGSSEAGSHRCRCAEKEFRSKSAFRIRVSNLKRGKNPKVRIPGGEKEKNQQNSPKMSFVPFRARSSKPRSPKYCCTPKSKFAKFKFEKVARNENQNNLERINTKNINSKKIGKNISKNLKNRHNLANGGHSRQAHSPTFRINRRRKSNKNNAELSPPGVPQHTQSNIVPRKSSHAKKVKRVTFQPTKIKRDASGRRGSHSFFKQKEQQFFNSKFSAAKIGAPGEKQLPFNAICSNIFNRRAGYEPSTMASHKSEWIPSPQGLTDKDLILREYQADKARNEAKVAKIPKDDKISDKVLRKRRELFVKMSLKKRKGEKKEYVSVFSQL